MALVTSTLTNGILRVVLCNARKRNPLSSEALNQLECAFRTASDKSCRAVVITAEGPVFSAGHDLRELKSLDPQKQYELFARCGSLMNSLRHLEVPVLAAVEGLAAAAGCQLVAACDMAVAGPEARFSLPGASVGLFCSAPSVPVVRCVGQKAAAFMLYTGTNIDAIQALRFGLISHRAESNEALGALVEDIVQDIARKPKDVISLGKRFLQREAKVQEVRSYEDAARVMADNLQLKNGKEGLESFVEKRHPHWQ
ncbi:enoyl-CoA hydratase domain-containing protein 3, mitochondrial [Galendromus occidentalis]|uniref:Enoyl-CoA hydratase domain-containing protein 3, mitochondrial n=1 Tax=Galendromus occidentalis TaxID=34638 RepID=A0AAJ6VY74_9ACAR|nr:enoyl-CoA hydratase domain-containing protein 3, mitochondrial [Galendromus occidentalis]